MKAATLTRATLRTSRSLDFLSEKGLTTQIGHPREQWPLVALKELVDNSIDACEEAGIAPVVKVTMDENSLTIEDNGPGIAADIVKDVLDFDVRVSSREAYVSPTRGAQGNALKAIVAMPYVIYGHEGQVEIDTVGSIHTISLGLDRIRQQPTADHEIKPNRRKKGTSVKLVWPDLTSSIEDVCGDRFLQIADSFGWLNPHLDLSLRWTGDAIGKVKPTDTEWHKSKPTDPTSPHWYQPQHLERLVAGYIANERDITVREFVSEFHGLTATAKQKRVLEATGLARERLSSLVHGCDLDHPQIERLLQVMKNESKPVKPMSLGIIGEEHFRKRFGKLGCAMESFQYVRRAEVEDGLPELLEVAFGYVPSEPKRRLVSGVNWTPGILNPFRELGSSGHGMERVLSDLRVDDDEPVIVLMHLATPRPQYLDRGKSSVVTT